MGVALAAQQGSQARPPVAEQVFKNIQVLKGIPVDDFMDTMGIMSAALGFDCVECHVAAGTDNVNWQFDTRKKRTARRMTLMVAAINKANFGAARSSPAGRVIAAAIFQSRCRRSTPFTASRLSILTKSSPSRSPENRRPIRFWTNTSGTWRRRSLAKVTSFIATGTSEGFRGFGGGGQVQIFAKAPDQRATIIKFAANVGRPDAIRVFDGRNGWVSAPLSVVPEYALGGSELDGARVDAQLSFPAQIKKVLTQLRVGSPDNVNGRDVHVVQGNGPRGLVATLYFDSETGLLLRMVRFGTSPIGRAPTQVDFSDYRDVPGAGIKMPYRWTFGWLNGRDSFELKEVRVNVPIDAQVFAPKK